MESHTYLDYLEKHYKRFAIVDLEAHGRTLRVLAKKFPDERTLSVQKKIMQELAVKRLSRNKKFLLTDELEHQIIKAMKIDCVRFSRRRFKSDKITKRYKERVAKEVLRKIMNESKP